MSVLVGWPQTIETYSESWDHLLCLPSYRFQTSQHLTISIWFWKCIFGKPSIDNAANPLSVLGCCSLFSQFEFLLIDTRGSSPRDRWSHLRTDAVRNTYLLSLHSRSLLTEWYRILRQNATAINFINANLEEIGYPHTFNRRPRDFSNFHKWKASELRCFFIYTVLPLCVKLRLNMPECFPEVYLSHFSLLFIYVRVLRYYDDPSDINNMPVFIHAYLRHFSELYHQCKELYSVHSLVHLWQQVKQHGALAYHRYSDKYQPSIWSSYCFYWLWLAFSHRRVVCNFLTS